MIGGSVVDYGYLIKMIDSAPDLSISHSLGLGGEKKDRPEARRRVWGLVQAGNLERQFPPGEVMS